MASRPWLGAAWYPELRPECVEEDLALMREAGIHLVRVWEFAWSFLEPEEARFDPGWLGRILDRCSKAGISVILGTPSAAPPRWLTLRYPEVLRVDADGKPWGHGSRCHASHASERYRALSCRIAEVMARAFGRHPALAAWQVDNELLCHVGPDFSEAAGRAWTAWLKAKYRSVAVLNARWGAGVWSQAYPSFGSVPMPAKTPYLHHGALLTDWHRFTSECSASFFAEQAAVIRRHSKAPVTHNHVIWDGVYAEDLFEKADFASADFYVPHGRLWEQLGVLDLLRGVKPGVPYVLMETSPSQNGDVTPGHAAHPDGFLAAEAMIVLGRGGRGLCYWPWRQQASGVETCHGAVVTAWGTRSAGWRNVKAVGEMMRKLEPLLEIPPASADLAVHESRENRAFLRAQPLATYDRLERVEKPLLKLGIRKDVRFDSADVSGFKAVWSPFMPILTDALVARMTRFVKAGGAWLVGPMSGCRTGDAGVHKDAGLGKLDALAGVKTLWSLGVEGMGYAFALEPLKGTKVLGRFRGHAWAVERKVGKGRVVLLAADPGEGMARMLDGIFKELPRLKASWGTELMPREGKGRKAWLVANWDGKGGWVELPEGGQDVLTGKRLAKGRLKVAPFGVHAVEVRA